jgi:predicted lipoprotein with Yx(FWY)xxD motif
VGHGLVADVEADHRDHRLIAMRIHCFVVAALTAFGLTGGALAAVDVPAEVTTRVTGVGTFFADAKGMTLYTYARDDKPGKSNCVEECIKAWPALMAPEAAQGKGAWSIVTREDGAKQWAFRGKPLYTFARDKYPGGVFGERVGNAWSVAYEPIVIPPGLKIRALFVGRVLTDQRGMTLYWRDDEKDTKVACTAKCLEMWVPAAAPALATKLGDWSALSRPDGTLQWAYQGRRLYAYAKDLKAGEVRGDGLDKVWRAANLDPAQSLPSWVSIQRSDMGEIYADARGMTLYTFSGSMERTRQLICNDECMNKFWRAVPADSAPVPTTSEWTIVADAVAGNRWAYKGNLLYTHTRDSEPGGIGGDKWAAGAGGGGGGFSPIQVRRDYEE